MLWQIDPNADKPLFEQVAMSVRRAIGSGTLTKGERLPAAREVAEALDINLHTVLRAYQLLRDEGLIELRRGRGAVVQASDPGRARLDALVAELVSEGTRLGLDHDELADLVAERSPRHAR